MFLKFTLNETLKQNDRSFKSFCRSCPSCVCGVWQNEKLFLFLGFLRLIVKYTHTRMRAHTRPTQTKSYSRRQTFFFLFKKTYLQNGEEQLSSVDSFNTFNIPSPLIKLTETSRSKFHSTRPLVWAAWSWLNFSKTKQQFEKSLPNSPFLRLLTTSNGKQIRP